MRIQDVSISYLRSCFLPPGEPVVYGDDSGLRREGVDAGVGDCPRESDAVVLVVLPSCFFCWEMGPNVTVSRLLGVVSGMDMGANTTDLSTSSKQGYNLYPP